MQLEEVVGSDLSAESTEAVTRCSSKKLWDQTRKDLELDIDWNRWDTTGCIVRGGDLVHIGSSITE